MPTYSEPLTESDSRNTATWIFTLEKVLHLVHQKKAQGYSKILPFKFGLLSRSPWPTQNEATTRTQSLINLFFIAK